VTLDRDDISALAVAIVDEQERRNAIRLDAQYAASLDLDELKRRNHQKLMATRKRRASK
jgi:hypothetical protein